MHNTHRYNELINSPLLAMTPCKSNDYSLTLERFGLEYKLSAPYLQVGEITKVQGWILDISVIKIQLAELLELLIPVLIVEKVPFKIVIDDEIASNLLYGILNYTDLGKVICIYPPSDVEAAFLAKKVIKLTQSFRGPAIPTDAYLGGCVYTRYGGFKPVVLTDSKGKRNKYIYDCNGNLIKDSLPIPFILPTGVVWPFGDITEHVIPPSKNLLNNKYKPISVIKPDVKGDVIKAIYFKSFLNIKQCIIKQGKKNMYVDDIGRSIQDRLMWQKELHNSLTDEIPLPKIFDFFFEDEDAYLVMEFINGQSLNEAIESVRKDMRWIDLPLSDKVPLLNNLSKIFDIIEHLHQKGYVHRDITPFNFIIDKKNRLFLIDMELAFSLDTNNFYPPFQKGTFGFISPEQEASQRPTAKEDIYGIGGLMIYLFTNLLPGKFDTSDPASLLDNLHFFIPSSSIVNTIIACLNANPKDRPEIKDIKKATLAYREYLISHEVSINEQPVREVIDKDKLKNTINGALRALTSPLMTDIEHLWVSKKKVDENQPGNEQMTTSCYCGFYEGISGVMYLVALAKQNFFYLDDCIPIYLKNYMHLQAKYLDVVSEIAPGLHAGTAGIALALVSGIESGLLKDKSKTILQIKECLLKPSFGLDIAAGVTGQGMALLNCAAFLDKNFVQNLLRKYIDILLDNQEKDGSWIIPVETPGKSNLKISGLTQGVAGIARFLLACASRYFYKDAQYAAVKALHWLIKQAQKRENTFFWYINNKNKIVDPWVRDGVTGIALTFIKAYGLLNEPHYKNIAEGALRCISSNAISGEFCQSNGLSGLGEVYLEASRIFRTEEWGERADWITQIFLNTYKKASDGSFYWLADSTSSFPTADLLVGNSGIIHFLMRRFLNENMNESLLPI